MSNQWSNLTIEEKFFKTIEFHAFWGKQKSKTFGVIIKNGTHHLIQLLFSNVENIGQQKVSLIFTYWCYT